MCTDTAALAELDQLEAIPALDLTGWTVVEAILSVSAVPPFLATLDADLRPISPEAIQKAMAAPSLIEGFVGSCFELNGCWFLITSAADCPDPCDSELHWSRYARITAEQLNGDLATAAAPEAALPQAGSSQDGQQVHTFATTLTT